ncbi:MAG: xylulokinase, partial [Acidimicrobiales bacterium]
PGVCRMTAVTVGIDIGTTSTKAVAVDDRGEVLARSRVAHPLLVAEPGHMEHDADRAWRRGPRRALAGLGDVGARAVGVAAMAPSLTAVDGRGRPTAPGLLYGDWRGRATHAEMPGPGGNGEMSRFLRWLVAEVPGAAGYWPAQAVATRALGGAAAIDLAVAFTASPIYGPGGWDASACDGCGAAPGQLPGVEPPGAAVGRTGPGGPLLSAGSVDVWCEQMVAGADEIGDVHVICGTTLVVWAVVANRGNPPDGSKAGDGPAERDLPGRAVIRRRSGHGERSTGDQGAPQAVSSDAAWPETPGLWTVPHPRPGLHRVGGASSAGGLFIDWAGRLFGKPAEGERVDPSNVPVWAPYPRGERTPYHDPDRRASLHSLDLTHSPAAVQRAAWEASGFVVRHHLDLATVTPRRIVATGGGTLVEGWMRALADTTGVPVHVASVPEGAARGAAFLARMAAGLETDFGQAANWASTARVIEPDPVWAARAAGRYSRFLELSDGLGPAEPRRSNPSID